MDKPYFQQLGERIRIKMGETLKTLTWILDLRPAEMARKHNVDFMALQRVLKVPDKMADLTFMQAVLLWLSVFEKEGLDRDDLLLHDPDARSLFDFADEYQEYLNEEKEYWTYKGLVPE